MCPMYRKLRKQLKRSAGQQGFELSGMYFKRWVQSNMLWTRRGYKMNNNIVATMDKQVNWFMAVFPAATHNGTFTT